MMSKKWRAMRRREILRVHLAFLIKRASVEDLGGSFVQANHIGIVICKYA